MQKYPHPPSIKNQREKEGGKGEKRGKGKRRKRPLRKKEHLNAKREEAPKTQKKTFLFLENFSSFSHPHCPQNVLREMKKEQKMEKKFIFISRKKKKGCFL